MTRHLGVSKPGAESVIELKVPKPSTPVDLTRIGGTTTYSGGAAGIGQQLETERHRRGPQWREIRGAAPYRLLGEDAQTWVGLWGSVGFYWRLD